MLVSFCNFEFWNLLHLGFDSSKHKLIIISVIKKIFLSSQSLKLATSELAWADSWLFYNHTCKEVGWTSSLLFRKQLALKAVDCDRAFSRLELITIIRPWKNVMLISGQVTEWWICQVEIGRFWVLSHLSCLFCLTSYVSTFYAGLLSVYK